jgi:asparagine synthase (glutamine-hydrolysing)
MCGIGGIMTNDGTPPESGVLDRLSGLLSHRGPDGNGHHLSGDVGMVQTRLAIIDLETGDQPIYVGESRRSPKAALVANGEIYNYVELKCELDKTSFSTGSDCELPLHLYLSHGYGFAKYLRGMYAIAIHDIKEKKLILSRDPFGIKPLYYSETDVGFVFASEAQAIIRAGLVTAKLNRMQRDELMQLQFTTGEKTVFQGIFRMRPGETLVVQGGKIVSRSYQKALPNGRRKHIDESEALNDLDAVLMDSIVAHQRSDVPYGMFFSGGIDSSVLLGMMSRLNERPVKALTAGFSGTITHDERMHARSVADAVGAAHIGVEFSEEDFYSLLPKIASAVDDPTADYAILPTFKLAACARAEGLKVVLSGEGGDELFGGYGRYRHAMRPWPFSKSMRRKGVFHGLGVLRENSTNWRVGFAISERDALAPERNTLQVAQAIDCADWLSADLLTKLDRCLMAHGVEGRVPFLDPAVAQTAYLLPDHLKIKHGKGKWLLRSWLKSNLPAANPLEAKRGFTVPVGEWIAGRSGKLGQLIAAQSGIREVCRPGKVEALFTSTGKRQGKAQWTLLFYALWHQAHILGQSSQGDVFDALSS